MDQQPAARQVTINLEDPASYSDYMASDQAIAQQLTSFGIKTTVDGVSVNAWNSDLSSGHFQMTLHWGQTAATPYGQYRQLARSVAHRRRRRQLRALRRPGRHRRAQGVRHGREAPPQDRAAVKALGSIVSHAAAHHPGDVRSGVGRVQLVQRSPASRLSERPVRPGAAVGAVQRVRRAAAEAGELSASPTWAAPSPRGRR